MEKQKFLIVVDMQNDFIDGSLGTKEAQAIVPAVTERIKALKAEGCTIIEVADKTPWVEAVKDVVSANINGEDAAYEQILAMK